MMNQRLNQKKMKMRTGSQTVYLYGKKVPKSGKSIIEFSGIKLCHRSIKADKSDVLVHVDSGIIARAYPIGTGRGVVIEDIANNLDKLKHFIFCPEEFLIEDRPKILKVKKEDTERKYETSMTHYSNGEKVEPRKNKKKKFNVMESVW